MKGGFRRGILWGMIVVLLLALGACEREEATVVVDLSKRERLEAPVRPFDLTYAYLPQYTHEVSFQRHHDLVVYLQKQTGLRVRQVYPDTFDDHMTMVHKGRIDISFVNPFVYVKMADAGDARAFARIEEPEITIGSTKDGVAWWQLPGRAHFRGQVIVRGNDSRFARLEDCRGKRWIAVDHSSAGGYLYPLGLFYEHGITAADFAEIAFSPGPGGKQEKVVMAVLAGRYDLGSIREGTLDVMKGIIADGAVRVLAHTKWYPGWVYAARTGLEPSIVDAVRQALLALEPTNPADRKILEMAGFLRVIVATDADYKPIRRLIEEIGPLNMP
ncbi:phosphate/phosphite/phosphonate ABC transporter substrate-binding protein [Desulfovibrio inopinatus]|uniref:phosphate/phosphite/phosphonate ABC transporter substrate-binding protein n=1 Tax=Desulfovibrio inopinatus TaxID=102109 RepID=UPI00042423F7|nr:phosphate/phosphite/phosphonate ABC transporter substrate-binding protein [Desulfovibrio inopinatus]